MKTSLQVGKLSRNVKVKRVITLGKDKNKKTS